MTNAANYHRITGAQTNYPSVFAPGSNIPIQVALTGNVVQVDFYNHNQLMQTVTSVTSSSVTWNWTSVPVGNYSITAIATDTNGATAATPLPDPILVTSLDTPPQVSITSPAPFSTIAAGTNLVIQATATEAGGTISQVDFYQGDVLLGTATSPPYQVTWPNVPVGQFGINAVATNSNGTTFAALPIQITVTSGPTGPVFSNSPALLNFFAVPGGIDPPSQVAAVGNLSSTQPLQWTLSSNVPWLSATPSGGSDNQEVVVSATIAGLSLGSYVGTLTFTDPNASPSQAQIPVSLVISSYVYVPPPVTTQPPRPRWLLRSMFGSTPIPGVRTNTAARI